jgi:hypothetical protein
MREDPTMEDCDVYLSYNPCETETFVCELTGMGDYGMETDDCVEDFLDGEFWAMMSEEDFWFERELYDFYNFWERYHGNQDDDEIDCDWKSFNTRCSDFEFIRREMEEDENPQDCDVFLSYSPCEHDYFVCESWAANDYGVMEMDDCQEDFTEFEFWNMMRLEQWWMEHPETYDFYMYWDEYHFGSGSDDYHGDDDHHCEDRQVRGTCADFAVFEDEGACDWVIMYNSCPENEVFTCRSFYVDDYEGFVAYDCLEDFMDHEFWMEFRNEDWWMRPEN